MVGPQQDWAPDGAQRWPFTAQLFGSRELTLALAIIEPTSPQLRTRALQLGLLVDTLDVIAAVRGHRGRTLSGTGVIVAGGGAALFASLGVAALSGQVTPPSRRPDDARPDGPCRSG